MSQDTIYVDCPCCGARMEVRREDGRVMQHWSKTYNKKSGGDPIKEAQEKLKSEKDRLSKYLAGANEILEKQKRDALEKFEREKRRVNEEGDNTPPPSPFGFD